MRNEVTLDLSSSIDFPTFNNECRILSSNAEWDTSLSKLYIWPFTEDSALVIANIFKMRPSMLSSRRSKYGIDPLTLQVSHILFVIVAIALPTLAFMADVEGENA